MKMTSKSNLTSKTWAFVALAALAATSQLRADVSPECLQMAGDYTIQHYGNSFIAAQMTYTLKLHFEPDKKGLDVASNWGINYSFSLDAENESVSARQLGLMKFVQAAADPYESLRVTNLALQSVYGAQKNLRVSKGQDRATLLKILECAKARLATYNVHIRRNYVQTRAVEVSGAGVEGH
jgi:hypothetical protein